MMDLFNKFYNSSVLYYSVLGLFYILAVVFVTTIILNKRRNNKKKKIKDEAAISIEPEEINNNKVDLEAMLEQMQGISNKPKEAIMTFEQEQEEKAIISYQELLNAVKKNEIKIEDDEKDIIKAEPLSQTLYNLNPINLEDEEIRVIPMPKKPEKEIKIEQTKPVLLEKKKILPYRENKFKNTEFISPIYGRIDKDSNYSNVVVEKEESDQEFELEKTVIMEPIKNNSSNDEFLRALKEFRNSL